MLVGCAFGALCSGGIHRPRVTVGVSGPPCPPEQHCPRGVRLSLLQKGCQENDELWLPLLWVLFLGLVPKQLKLNRIFGFLRSWLPEKIWGMEIPDFVTQGSPAPYPADPKPLILRETLTLLLREANPTAPLIFCPHCNSMQGMTRQGIPMCHPLAAPLAGQQHPLMHYFTPWLNITWSKLSMFLERCFKPCFTFAAASV